MKNLLSGILVIVVKIIINFIKFKKKVFEQM